MNIELVPVIEIGYFNQGVEAPLNRPFWDYPQEWDAYWKKLLSLAGFTMPMESYIPGASIFSPTLISDANLRKIVNNHLSSSSGDEPDWSDLLPLDGGYVLRTDGSDRLFPQCCSDLGSFDSWKRVSLGDISAPWTGHPEPRFEFFGDEILIHCDNEWELFIPPTDKRISISRMALQDAVRVTEGCLQDLDLRISRILKDLNVEVSSKAFIQDTYPREP